MPFDLQPDDSGKVLGSIEEVYAVAHDFMELCLDHVRDNGIPVAFVLVVGSGQHRVVAGTFRPADIGSILAEAARSMAGGITQVDIKAPTKQ